MAGYYSAQATADHRILRSIDIIKNIFGDNVDASIEPRNLFKFGSNGDLGTAAETLQDQGGEEIYVNSNAIDSYSSSSAADTGTALIVGHTISGGILTRVIQEVTLAGQTKSLLTTPLARIERVYNNDTATWLGDIYVYEDDTVTAGVPDTASKIHAKVLIGNNQTQKCSASVAGDEYLLVTRWHASVFKKTDSFVDFDVETRDVAATPSTWRVRGRAATSRGGGGVITDFDPPFILPKNTDWRVRGIASAGSTVAYSSVHGIYLKVI